MKDSLSTHYKIVPKHEHTIAFFCFFFNFNQLHEVTEKKKKPCICDISYTMYITKITSSITSTGNHTFALANTHGSNPGCCCIGKDTRLVRKPRLGESLRGERFLLLGLPTDIENRYIMFVYVLY